MLEKVEQPVVNPLTMTVVALITQGTACRIYEDPAPRETLEAPGATADTRLLQVGRSSHCKDAINNAAGLSGGHTLNVAWPTRTYK